MPPHYLTVWFVAIALIVTVFGLIGVGSAVMFGAKLITSEAMIARRLGLGGRRQTQG